MSIPSTYSQFIAEVITSRIANGETLKSVLESEGMPEASTVRRWRMTYGEFDKLYQRARVDHADSIADDIINIADNTLDPQKARNMIDARKWRSGVLNPKVYGTKLDVNINDKPDIKKALADANNRLLIVNAQYEEVEDNQVIDTVDVIERSTGDYKSLDPHDNDIFS